MNIVTSDHNHLVAALLLPLFSLTAYAQSADTADTADAANIQAQVTEIESCIMANMQSVSPDTPIGEMLADCEQIIAKSMNGKTQLLPDDAMTPVEERILDDQINYDRSYAISAFQPNYFLATYSSDPNEEPFRSLDGGEDILDNAEVKFQISMKAPLWRNMFGSNNDLLAAYTSISWWQIGNDNISSAFRETNYQPEVFLRHYGGPKLFGGRLSAFDVGLNHQSNGRSELLSRSWNRVMGRAYLDFNNLAFALRTWYRIPDDEDEDDNPNMYQYYGYGDITAAYAPNKNTFTAMLRPGTKGNGLEVTWSYPITKAIRIYSQYWNGYGESLLDYNVRNERIGIGIALNDWLERR
jgi:phospholipase A1